MVEEITASGQGKRFSDVTLSINTVKKLSTLHSNCGVFKKIGLDLNCKVHYVEIFV